MDILKRIITFLIIATLMTLSIPAAPAAETTTEEYTGTTGARILGYGTTMSWRPCPGGCDLDGDGNEDVPDVIRFGGGPLFASQPYNNVVVSVSDDIFGSNAATQVCFWNPEGETVNICEGGGEDYLSDTLCGPVALTGSPYAGDRVTVWVYSLVVTEDLAICGGWAGTMTGDFF